MSWEKKPVPAPLIDGLEDIATAITSITQPVIVLLETALAAIEVAKIFFLTSANPTTALANALIGELEKLNNDTFGTGVFQLVVQPFDISTKFTIPGVGLLSSVDTDAKLVEFAQAGATFALDDFGIPALSPQTNISKILQSFDDEGDSERPQFSDGAQVTAFGFMITAPNVGDFNDILESLLAVWEIGDFRKLLNRLKESINAETAGVIPIPSRKPDWDSVRFNSVDFLAKTQNEINKQLAFLKGLIGSVDDILGDFIILVERKITNLKTIIEEFNALINTIKNALSASGVYLLNVPPATGGNEYLKEQINDPQFQSSKDSISASVIYVGGGASLAPVDAIRTILS